MKWKSYMMGFLGRGSIWDSKYGTQWFMSRKTIKFENQNSWHISGKAKQSRWRCN